MVVLASMTAPPARAEEIELRTASLRATEEGLVLDAEFAFELTPRLAEAVASGVPLYFRIDFELTRPRWYWFDETTASRRLQRRLSYHALSRQYRLSTGLLQQNFATLEEALNVLKRVRNWLVVDRTVSLSGGDYEAAVRMRLDTSLLPKPFQLSALTSRDFQLESPWHRFTVHSLEQAPAPVESRETQGAAR
jgi:hypothetical protein